MKNIYIIILSIFIAFSVVLGQSADSTNSEKKKEQVKSKSEQQQQEQKKSTEQDQERKKVKEQEEARQGQEAARDVQPQGADRKLEGFVDTNGNGIDDRLEPGSKGYRKGKNAPRDRFVDTDGDGICDGKESAIGLRKLYRKRKGNSGNK
jgi:Ni/Co efflux regulator RcnB